MHLQEEISHCAAGVRWLRHLHQHAQHQATTSSLAAAAAQPQRLEAVTLAEQPAASLQPQVQQGQPTCHNDVGQQAAAGNYDWVADAQQYDTVEQWFHALIRRHFKGNLKVSDAATRRSSYAVDLDLCVMLCLDTTVSASSGYSSFSNVAIY